MKEDKNRESETPAEFIKLFGVDGEELIVRREEVLSIEWGTYLCGENTGIVNVRGRGNFIVTGEVYESVKDQIGAAAVEQDPTPKFLGD